MSVGLWTLDVRLQSFDFGHWTLDVEKVTFFEKILIFFKKGVDFSTPPCIISIVKKKFIKNLTYWRRWL